MERCDVEPVENPTVEPVESPTVEPEAELNECEFAELCYGASDGACGAIQHKETAGVGGSYWPLSLLRRKTLEGFVSYLKALEKEKGAKIGPKTLFPSPDSGRQSPFVLLALYSKLDALQYVCSQYADAIEINHKSFLEDSTLHLSNHDPLRNVTALNAAAIGGHASTVSYLLQKQGADPGVADCCGYSPLCNAAMWGHTEVAEVLLAAGANAYHLTSEGYTPLHLAAKHGTLSIVKTLLSHGVSPLFAEANSEKNAYVPCPFFLAAANGHEDIVKVLAKHRKCPVRCRADAYLLLGAHKCLWWTPPRRSQLPSHNDVLDPTVMKHWTTAFSILGSSNLEVASITSESYDGRSEVRNMTEFTAQVNTLSEARQQAVLVFGRCMGTFHCAAIQHWSLFNSRRNYSRITKSMKPILQAQLKKCAAMIENKQYCTLENEVWLARKTLSLVIGVKWLHDFSTFAVDWPFMISYGVKFLEWVAVLHSHGYRGRLPPHTITLSYQYKFLVLLASWISQEASVDDQDHVCFPEELAKVGSKFVSVCNQLSPRMNPLSFLISWENCKDFELVFRVLLEWDADCDAYDASGERPLHIASRLFYTTNQLALPLLMKWGVHLDAVNSIGKSAMDFFSHQKGQGIGLTSEVSPLACLCCRKIIAEGMAYGSLELPPHIKYLIGLHDKHTVKATMTLFQLHSGNVPSVSNIV